MRSRASLIIFISLLSVLIISLVSPLVPQQRPPSEMPARQASNLTAPHIVIIKGERRLELFDGDRLVKKYEMALGFTPLGDKEISGDGKTPEGEFYVFVKNDKSRFYLSLGVSYPAVEDAERGFREKLISRREYTQIINAIAKKQMPPQNTKLGGTIYIHGGGVGQDWTWGCIALVDSDIKEIYTAAKVGMRVTIRP